MSSGLKNDQNSLRKVDIDTTLSGKLHAINALIQEQKPSVSPFQLENHGEAKSLLGLSLNQLNVVKDINYQYVQLYQHIFKENKKLGQYHSSNKDQSRSSQILNKEQKYQLQCIKLLNCASQNIQKLRHMRQIRHEATIISNFAYQINSQRDQSFSIEKQREINYVQLANYLMERYQQVSLKIKQAEGQYNMLTSTNLQIKEESKVMKLQKQLKTNKKKLSNILVEEQKCLIKCSEQQNILEELQKQIKKCQKQKLNIEMKIIGEQGKRDKIARKIKKQKEKSVNNFSKKEQQQKNTISKSLTKWKLPRYEFC